MGGDGISHMNKDEFTEQVLEIEKSLYYVSKSILSNDEDCKDAIQNTIFKAYKNLGNLREDCYFKTWITRILINECYGIAKTNKRQVPYEDYMMDLKEKTNFSEVYIEIRNLEEKYRVPFVLHYVEGFSLQEISKMLKTTEAGIKMRLLRARRVLKEQLR